MMKRSEAREQAFTLVFEKAFREDSIEEIIDAAIEARMLVEDAFCKNLAVRTFAHVEEIDTIISKYSDKWKISRLPKVTLAILRLALCELDYFEDIPTAVTIDEAVELAKKYSSDEDAAYINGVLGAYVRQRTEVQE